MQVGDLWVVCIATTSYRTGPFEVMAIHVSDEGVHLTCGDVGDDEGHGYHRVKRLIGCREVDCVKTSKIGDTLNVQLAGSACQPPLFEVTAP